MTYPIDKGIPLPEKAHAHSGGWPKHGAYPWDQMEPGDSFFVPLNDKSERTVLNRVATASNRRSNSFAEKYTCRTVYEDGEPIGVRCWRVE